jgi:hypothetical protein
MLQGLRQMAASIALLLVAEFALGQRALDEDGR